ncbi:hypothetical protein ACFL6S_12895 [Candidatus Poribacteria bacterium]
MRRTVSIAVAFLSFLIIAASVYSAEIGVLFDTGFKRTSMALDNIGIEYDDLQADVANLGNYNLIIIGHGAVSGQWQNTVNYTFDLGTPEAEAITAYVEGGGSVIVMFQDAETGRGKWQWMPEGYELEQNNNAKAEAFEISDPSHPVFNRPNKVDLAGPTDKWGDPEPWFTQWEKGDFMSADPLVVPDSSADKYKALVKTEGADDVHLVEAELGEGRFMVTSLLCDSASISTLNDDAQRQLSKDYFENLVVYGLGGGGEAVNHAEKLIGTWGRLKDTIGF